ncbi:hypothetical protein L914_04530 [Phytophthora nicotianae]|uniref:Uncharacterized protein n=1 Tax=Phytophthora nicotianae TaxID=4792 RepID=W2NSQ6_PHYNI|nr:hypothetical protein L914_04530 [Phytophthora nicotianae]
MRTNHGRDEPSPGSADVVDMKDASPAPSTSSGGFQRADPSSASSFGHNRPALRERTSPSYRSTATSRLMAPTASSLAHR